MGHAVYVIAEVRVSHPGYSSDRREGQRSHRGRRLKPRRTLHLNKASLDYTLRNYMVDWERAQAERENKRVGYAAQTGRPMTSTAGPSGIASITANFSTVRNGEAGDAR